MKLNKKSLLACAMFAFVSINAYAAKTYSEDDFLRSFSGKSNTIVLEKLGNRKERHRTFQDRMYC